MCFCLFLISFDLFCFSYKTIFKKIENFEKYKNGVCMCTLVLVYFEWPLKQSFLNFLSKLDEHLYAQLSK